MSVEIMQYLPQNIREIIKNMGIDLEQQLLEIRLRVQQPLQIITYHQDYFVTENGRKTLSGEQGYRVTGQDIEKAMLKLTENSLYAMKRQLREGFITIKGGHRVGFTGEVIMEEGKIKTIKNVNSLNYRLTREVIGTADKIIEKLYNNENETYYNTLIISPPLCGKTTLLRDLIRLISRGSSGLGIKGKKIGVVDERSELAGAYQGIAQNRIGNRTDLLDNCPKSEGMLLLIRSMSPEIIAVDEIGGDKDIKAVKEALNAGVTLITTVHGNDIDSLKLRPGINLLLEKGFFQRYVILSKKEGVGTVEQVLNYEKKEVI